MLTNEAYKPINCDDYDNLELACQNNWMLQLELKNGEKLKAKATDMVSRKNVEYLAIDLSGEVRELRLDHIASFTHPTLGTVVVVSETD
uniref:Rho-binding antiterminator n=1 Tax=Pantoea sp. IMH TaxID=1267600 RepID=UPI0004691163|nr:Rho-binding antiterminator [Pantoea sp. IMH]